MMFEKLRHQSATDPLTGLFNRSHLREVLNNEMNRKMRYGIPFSCIMIDMDGFKTINDSLGHAAGDYLLIEFAKLLTANVRTTDICVRYGGDEFVVVLPHTDIEPGLDHRAQTRPNRLRKLPLDGTREPCSSKPVSAWLPVNPLTRKIRRKS